MSVDPLAPASRCPWPDDPDVAAVILCGGKGSRLWPLTLQHQKSMLPVCGGPILQHVIDFWRPFVHRFIFVVKTHREEVESYVASQDFPAACVAPERLSGIADGVYQAHDLVSEHFVVILGDCVCTGELTVPAALAQGVVVWPTDQPDDIRRSYSVEIEGGRVTCVVEKPTELPNNLCGTGYYFLDRRVFDYIERQPPSALRGEKEITDVLQSMITAGEHLSPIWLTGDYVNVTFPEDLVRVERMLQSRPRGRRGTAS